MSASQVLRTKCPICLIDGPFEKGLDNHLSFHLEAFAIFSIPRGIFQEKSQNLELTVIPGKRKALDLIFRQILLASVFKARQR